MPDRARKVFKMSQLILLPTEQENYLQALDAAEIPEVRSAPAYACINGTMVKVDDKKHTYRTDTQEVLGTVGHTYAIHNLRIPELADPMQQFMDLLGAKVDQVYWSGSRCFVDLKLPFDLPHVSEKLTCKVSLGTDFAGLMNTVLISGIWRIICSNGMAVPYEDAKDASRIYRVRHTKNSVDRLSMAQDAAENMRNYFENVGLRFKRLAETPFTKQQLAQVLAKVDKVKDPDLASTRTRNKWQAIQDKFVSGIGIKGETAYDAFNAVTEYLTHDASVKGSDKGLARYESNLVGTADQYRANAWNVINNMIDQSVTSETVTLIG